MGLFRYLNLPKIHLVGHHAGASMALEIASVYPDEIFTCALSAPALATAEEQAAMFKVLAAEWNRPKEDGSHLSTNYFLPQIKTLSVELLTTCLFRKKVRTTS
jgi:alpha-beta hydrolase superfamily lysophospholipase